MKNYLSLCSARTRSFVNFAQNCFVTPAFAYQKSVKKGNHASSHFKDRIAFVELCFCCQVYVQVNMYPRVCFVGSSPFGYTVYIEPKLCNRFSYAILQAFWLHSALVKNAYSFCVAFVYRLFSVFWAMHLGCLLWIRRCFDQEFAQFGSVNCFREQNLIVKSISL